MTALEAVVSALLVTGFMATSVVWQGRLIQRAREAALKAQLRSLRASVAFHEARFGSRPESLEAMAAAEMDRLRAGGGSLGEPAKPLAQLEDPFGARYAYDQSKGSVWSQTSGYEIW